MKLNYETKGSEIQSIANDIKRSTADIVINEDHAIVVEVTFVNNGIVEGNKVWDEAIPPTTFSAMLRFRGMDGIPDNSAVKEGEHVIFHRVGEYKGSGQDGFELHEPDTNKKTSWLCLIDSNPVIFVRDGGSGSGSNVVYNNGSWNVPADAENLSFVTTDPLSSYHNSLPPWKAGRVYPAQRIQDKYVVFLPGFGNPTKTFTQTVDSVKWNIKTDSSGKVIEFEAVEVT